MRFVRYCILNTDQLNIINFVKYVTNSNDIILIIHELQIEEFLIRKIIQFLYNLSIIISIYISLLEKFLFIKFRSIWFYRTYFLIIKNFKYWIYQCNTSYYWNVSFQMRMRRNLGIGRSIHGNISRRELKCESSSGCWNVEQSIKQQGNYVHVYLFRSRTGWQYLCIDLQTYNSSSCVAILVTSEHTEVTWANMC